MSRSVVEVRGLTHRYGSRLALEDVSFDVRPGELFGLLGPNGGGKTTLFRILSTLLRPTQGSARVFDVDVVREPDRARERMAVVFQSPSVDRRLTVAENLRCQGGLYGMGGGSLRDRIRELLARFGLADRAGDLVEKLSGGLRRRVEIAKALLHRPSLLLLDEPTTGLDPGARLDLRTQLDELRRTDGLTLLLTTHLMDEAEPCDRVAILSRGRVVAFDSPAELKASFGAEVVTVATRDAARLAPELESALGVRAAPIGATVRVEHDRGAEIMARILEKFRDRIDSVTVGRPTLEDVFLQRTGHAFAEEP